MNIFKAIRDAFSSSEVGQTPTIDQPKELEFRVVTHFSGSDYYCLECKGKWGWYRVTRLYESADGEYDSLDWPILDSFDTLVALGKKFKADPASFEAHKQNQIDRYNRRQKAYRDKIKKHDERVEYI